MGTPTGRPATWPSVVVGGSRVGIEQRDVGGCAAHVEAEDAIDARGAGYAERADDAACGAGKNGAHRLARGRCGGEDAAGGLHDAEARAACGEAVLERSMYCCMRGAR